MKEQSKKKVILMIIGVIALLLVVVGATYAYFAAQIGKGDSAQINAQAGTTDSLSFNISDIDVSDNQNKIVDESREDDIIINANQTNFGPNGNSIGDGVKLNAHLIAGDDDKDAHFEYYVYLNISANNLEYTTPESTPELVLVVQDPTNGYIDEIKGLEKDEITLGEESVPCFDITKASGLITIASKYKIDATSENNGEADQNWQVSVIFKNLETDQHLNTNKSFQANLSIQSEKLNYLDFASNYDEENYEYTDYRSNDYYGSIKNVYFVNRIAEEGELNSVAKWDLSSSKDSSIMGWLKENEDPEMPYDLYIGSNLEDGEKIEIRNFDKAFYNLQDVETIDLNSSILDTSNLTDTSYMFRGFYNLETITGLEDLDVSNVTNMSEMFEGCFGISHLDLSGWDTHNVVDMSYMFAGMQNLKSIVGIEDLDVSNVTNMSSMFGTYTIIDPVGNSISSLNLSNWNTKSVTDMSDMFSGCNYLTTLNINGWNTHNVIDMQHMFGVSDIYTRSSLEKIVGIENLDVSNVTDMSNMFEGASGLTELDLSGWDTHNVTDMSYMFYGSSNLTSIDMRKATFSQVTSYGGMFGNTNSALKVIVTGDANKQWFIERAGTEYSNIGLTAEQLENLFIVL